MELDELFSDTGASEAISTPQLITFSEQPSETTQENKHDNSASAKKRGRKRGPYKKKKKESQAQQPGPQHHVSVLAQYSDYLNDKDALGPPPDMLIVIMWTILWILLLLLKVHLS